ncbi:Hypothetical predicted protein [Octopus vulgaris]|uniref:Uncharacterized protein n=1 Tax=Octopus vulgaris TaxID=6645 RepID=A0AA36FBU0_OCTVU|nr:Hypothetical predicted protein [Octopus vulgaris]
MVEFKLNSKSDENILRNTKKGKGIDALCKSDDESGFMLHLEKSIEVGELRLRAAVSISYAEKLFTSFF